MTPAFSFLILQLAAVKRRRRDVFRPGLAQLWRLQVNRIPDRGRRWGVALLIKSRTRIYLGI